MGRMVGGKHPLKYGCPFCEKRYTSRSGLLSHKNTIHLRRKPYRCEFCNEHFYTSAARVAHIHRWHSSPPKQSSGPALGCMTCGEVLFSIHSLEEHIRREHGEGTSIEEPPLPNTRPPPYLVPKRCCERLFDDPLELEVHQKYHHHGTSVSHQSLSCKTCSRKFETRESLDLHSSLCCGLSFVCKPCKMRYKNVDSYILHLQSHHREDAPNKDTCDASLPKKELQNAHLKSHEVCKRCRYVPSSNEDLKLHYEEKHTFSCNICPMMFSTLGALQFHQKMYHLQLCPICSKDCQDALVTHLSEQHAGQVFEEPQLCYKCSFNTLSINSYLDHMKEIHSHSHQ